MQAWRRRKNQVWRLVMKVSRVVAWTASWGRLFQPHAVLRKKACSFLSCRSLRLHDDCSWQPDRMAGEEKKPCLYRPVYSHNLSVFCLPKFSAYENTQILKMNTILNISTHVLWFVCFSSLEYAQFWGFSGTCVSLTTSRCRSFSFHIVLCVVSALNSWAIQSEAFISPAKYQYLPFFLKPSWNYFQVSFTKSKVKWKRNEKT